MAKWDILQIDPWIKDYEEDINLRMDEYEKQKPAPSIFMKTLKILRILTLISLKFL